MLHLCNAVQPNVFNNVSECVAAQSSPSACWHTWLCSSTALLYGCRALPGA